MSEKTNKIDPSLINLLIKDMFKELVERSNICLEIENDVNEEKLRELSEEIHKFLSIEKDHSNDVYTKNLSLFNFDNDEIKPFNFKITVNRDKDSNVVIRILLYQYPYLEIESYLEVIKI